MALMNNYSRVDISFKRGFGAVIVDENGKDYIDFAAGIGVCSLGHGDKRLVKAVREQTRKLIHTSNLYQIRPQIELSEKINELLGFDTYAFFCNSGAEANECAIKLARKYGTVHFENKKFEILTLKNSFHGRTLATIQATGQDKFHPEIFAPYMDGFKFYDSIDEIINNIGPNTVAVMIELVQGEGGVKALEKHDVRKLAAVLKEKRLLLITDEVQCGVFRTGEFVASKIYDIEPDIITFAKGLASGVPIGACLSKEDIFEPGDHGSTFGGNHLATACANVVLDELCKLKASGKLDENIMNFTVRVARIVQKYPDIFKYRSGLGLMQGAVVKDSQTLDLIYNKALSKGLLLLKSGKNTLRFLPPLNIKKSHIKEGFARLREVLNEI